MGWKNNIGESNPPVIFFFFFVTVWRMIDAGVDRSLAFTDVMEGNGKLKKKEGRGGQNTLVSFACRNACRIAWLFFKRQVPVSPGWHLSYSFCLFLNFYLGVRLFKKRLDTPVDIKWIDWITALTTTISHFLHFDPFQNFFFFPSKTLHRDPHPPPYH